MIYYWFKGARDIPDEYAGLFGSPPGIMARLARRAPARRGRAVSRDVYGPDGTKDRGLLASPTADGAIFHSPATQRWDRMADGVYIGCDLTASPDRLARPGISGVPVAMGDGHLWVLPVCNPFSAACTLPYAERLDENNDWVRQVDEANAWLVDAAGKLTATLRGSITSGGQVEIPDCDLRDIIAAAIAVNYDITARELSVMRVFRPEVYQAAVETIIDWETTKKDIVAAVEEAAAGRPFAPPGQGPPAGPPTAPGGRG